MAKMNARRGNPRDWLLARIVRARLWSALGLLSAAWHLRQALK